MLCTVQSETSFHLMSATFVSSCSLENCVAWKSAPNRTVIDSSPTLHLGIRLCTCASCDTSSAHVPKVYTKCLASFPGLSLGTRLKATYLGTGMFQCCCTKNSSCIEMATSIYKNTKPVWDGSKSLLRSGALWCSFSITESSLPWIWKEQI